MVTCAYMLSGCRSGWRHHFIVLRATLIASTAALLISVPLDLGSAQTTAPDAARFFDIPSQPLEAALEAFSAASGYHVALADSVATSLLSNAVSGVLPPSEAVGRLVAGSGLVIRFTSADAIVLTTDGRPATRATGFEERFDAQLQGDIALALCRSAGTRVGDYRAALDLWVAPSGRVERAELLATTGDAERDRRIVEVFRGLTVTPPPLGLRQPTTVLVRPRSPGANSACPVTRYADQMGTR